ncbi:hypothetical protein DL96DRAFT_1589098 [Flagelloscypha sp. PMI_526]|nr:hypothetical protein DL96DRAFT_1589098 [Flagelloscypha sp. PMI_526]
MFIFTLGLFLVPVTYALKSMMSLPTFLTTVFKSDRIDEIFPSATPPNAGNMLGNNAARAHQNAVQLLRYAARTPGEKSKLTKKGDFFSSGRYSLPS